MTRYGLLECAEHIPGRVRHCKAIGSCWRKLNPGRQALLVLAYLRKRETFTELAAGFEVGTTTAWRYVNETVELLAARAPKLRTAVKAGWVYMVLDGTLIPVGRVAADRPFYSGKHKKHGMNLLVIASPGGDILWVSGALPGVSACVQEWDDRNERRRPERHTWVRAKPGSRSARCHVEPAARPGRRASFAA